MEDCFNIHSDFIDDLSQLKGSDVKVFLVLKEKANTSKGDVWVECGYDELMTKTGIGHKNTIRLSIIFLAERGWIKDFKRGYYNKSNNTKKTNSYLIAHISEKDAHLNLHKEWFKKLMNWGKDK